MSLIRWSPRQDGQTLLSPYRAMDGLIDELFSSQPLRSGASPLTPPIDVEETPEAYVFRADLPGVIAKDVKITVTGDTLTLKGERKHEEQKSEGTLQRIERSYGAFERSFTLGTTVRPDQVRATYRDGVLEVRVPKADEARAREVEVQVG